MGVHVRRICLCLFSITVLTFALTSCDSDSSDSDIAAAIAARNGGFGNFGGGSGSGGPRIEDVKPGTGLPGSFSPNGPLDGFSGQVTRASDGSVVVGATVTLLDSNGTTTLGTTTTDSNGVYGFGSVAPGEYVVRTEADGLLLSERQVTYNGGTVQVGTSLSDPVPSGQFRAVLSWGERPIDLDAHLFLPSTTPYHIYYLRKGSLTSCPSAALDFDDTSSFGPETTTIATLFPGVYQYAVFNYGGDSNFNESNAFVEVYNSSGRIAGYRPPAGGSQRWWHVFSYNGTTVTPVNQLVDNFAPYPDTASGCSGL